jgi:hypothetical protein
MKINKKVTDFISLEDGNIGRRSAVVTGALLATSVLGGVLTTPAEAAWCHCDIPHSNHSNHYNTSGPCPLPC